MKETRLGVLGGSFNPVHAGHLHIARRIRDLFRLDRVHFVVAMFPPHKAPEELISFTHRYAMVALATGGMPDFVPSMIEAEPPASPYSIRTLAKLAERHGGGSSSIYFIAGGDSLLEVAGWHESGRMLSTYNFVFASRPGIEWTDAGAALPRRAASRICDLRGLRTPELERRLGREVEVEGSRIFLVDVEAPDVSASRIRELASSGQPIERLVPAPVEEYIRKLHLYGA